MQTFLPFADFEESARALDFRRLGKQRVEAQQILNALYYGGGWRHHPAVRMWEGYESALKEYRNVMIRAWVARGYRNTMVVDLPDAPIQMPPWMGERAFHASHRSNLLRKDPEFYSQYGWLEPPDLPYFWPGRDSRNSM